ncbi:hypothetical protein ABZV31_24255 [Streptomyces sp. NPDC005202]|uniref:hypothetical protein n=1 Tax=Streptomyces sp. NPDC005202 TaxID=3157021 RepID=UPI0033A8F01C
MRESRPSKRRRSLRRLLAAAVPALVLTVAGLMAAPAAGAHTAPKTPAPSDLSSLASSTVTLKFSGVEDSSLQTSFVIDDTALTTG